jgi:hypothetical protein
MSFIRPNSVEKEGWLRAVAKHYGHFLGVCDILVCVKRVQSNFAENGNTTVGPTADARTSVGS